jgi:hypothetical protein
MAAADEQSALRWRCGTVSVGPVSWPMGSSDVFLMSR